MFEIGTLKHCVEMYKSALSNHKNDMSKFNIKDLTKDRRRKNLIVEPASVSKKKNSIFIKKLGIIKSNIPLKTISQNSVLQYDTLKNKYIIITPKKVNKENYVEQYHKCGARNSKVRNALLTCCDQFCFAYKQSALADCLQHKCVCRHSKKVFECPRTKREPVYSKTVIPFLNSDAHKCKFINDNLKGNKIYDCPNCKLKIDRDINASINIYKNRTLTRSKKS